MGNKAWCGLGFERVGEKHEKVLKSNEQNSTRNDTNNAATLEDLAVRICVIFVLIDCDYVSDTVVAPVRESAAQTLAALLIHLNEETVIKIFHCLNSMVLQKIWLQNAGKPNMVVY